VKKVKYWKEMSEMTIYHQKLFLSILSRSQVGTAELKFLAQKQQLQWSPKRPNLDDMIPEQLAVIR